MLRLSKKAVSYSSASITKKEEESETAVFVISRIAGEGADRQAEGGDYFLTEEEHCRLEAVCRLYQNVVIIVNAGGQIDLSFLDEFCNIKGLCSRVWKVEMHWQISFPGK